MRGPRDQSQGRRQSPIGRQINGLAAIVGLTAILLGCGQPDPRQAVADLEALFPTLVDHRVDRLYRTDECEYIVYERGAFVTHPGSFDCEIDVDGPYPRSAIDEVVRADLDAIYGASERHGARLQAAFPEYAPDGTISGGVFGYHWCTSYIYEPGWKELPSDDSETGTPVNGDWYEVRCGAD